MGDALQGHQVRYGHSCLWHCRLVAKLCAAARRGAACSTGRTHIASAFVETAHVGEGIVRKIKDTITAQRREFETNFHRKIKDPGLVPMLADPAVP